MNDFLNKLLKGDIDLLSNEDKEKLTMNRQEVIDYLLRLFSKEISSLQKDKTCEDSEALFLGLQLAGFLGITEAFEWLHKLSRLPIDLIEKYLGIYFITEDLPYLLANTITQWEDLKSDIEDLELDEFILGSYFGSLVFAAAKGRIERSEVIHYFKTLFHRILNGDLDDISFTTNLVSSCSDLWPGECFEEVKEVFGLELVDKSFCDISSIYEDFARGKEYCIEKLQEQIEQSNFWNPLPPQYSFDQKKPSTQEFDQAEIEANQVLQELSIRKLQRNDICFCGSGKKYKKCCLRKNTSLNLPDKIRIEESTISYNPLEPHESMNELSKEEKTAIFSLYPLIPKNPEKVLEQASIYIKKYPNIPQIYNYLYCAYQHLNQIREAVKLLKKTLELFPDYLFARVEYALYLLRKGESEKACLTLGNVKTLSQLYPDRKVFHIIEWVAFSYAMGLCCIQKNELKQAKCYLDLLHEIAPQCHEESDLRKKIEGTAFHNSFTKIFDKDLFQQEAAEKDDKLISTISKG